MPKITLQKYLEEYVLKITLEKVLIKVVKLFIKF